MSVKMRFLLVAVWCVHALSGVRTVQDELILQVENSSSSSVTLSWDWASSNGTGSVYYLHRAPAAFPEPRPRTTHGFKFNMDNFIKFTNLNWSVSMFQFKFQFRTYSYTPTKTTILYVTSHPETALVGVQGSSLFLSLNCSGNTSQYTVGLHDFGSKSGSWIDVTVMANSSNVIVFSGERVVRIFQRLSCQNASSTNLNASAFIGGRPLDTPLDQPQGGTLMSDGFVGCIRDVRVSGQVLRQSSGVSGSGRRLSPCYSEIEDGMFFRSGGFVKYFKTVNVTGGMIHTLRFKSRRQHWVLLHVNQSNSNYSLQLVDGYLAFTQNTNTTTFRNTQDLLCDDRWHDVALICSNTSCSLQYDQTSLSNRLAPLEASLQTASLYIGGFPGGPGNDTAPVEREHKGCLQDLTFVQDTSHILEKYNVDLAGCPVFADVMSTCSDFIYEHKYIGYENTFQDNSVYPNTEYKFRVQARTDEGSTVLSEWVTVRSKERPESDKRNESADQMWLVYGLAGVAGLLLIALLVVIVVLCRRRGERANSNIDKERDRRFTVGQRYVSSERRPHANQQMNESQMQLVEMQGNNQEMQGNNQTVAQPEPEAPVYGNVDTSLYVNVEDPVYGNAEVFRHSRVS